jgi:hypothetical protein
MALLDASTKFFSTIFKRLHAAQKKQLRIIAKLNWENMIDDPEGITFNIPGEALRITREDYDGRIDIIPVSDPNISSSAHRMTMASQKLQSALQAPDIHDIREAFRSYYTAMGEENVDKLLPAQQEPQPLEPMQDIMAASKGQPIAAFPDQDHEAHISVKMAFLNDPSVMNNQIMGPAIPAIQANIQEHITMRFGEQLQGAEQLGINAQEAAQQLAEFNQWKAENPQGTLDPKQMLAQAEQHRQLNEERKLQLKEHEINQDALLQIMKLKGDLDKFEQENINKKDLEQFTKGLDMLEKGLMGS